MDGNGLSLPISGLRVSSTDLKTITADASGRAQRTLGARADWSWLWEAAALLSIEGTVAKSRALECSVRASPHFSPRSSRFVLTPCWRELDSNLRSHFEIGSAYAGFNYWECVRRTAEQPLFPEQG